MEGHLFRFQWVSHAWAFLARGRSFSFISFLRLGKQNHMKMAVLTKTCTRAQARRETVNLFPPSATTPAPLGKLRQKNFHKFKVRLDYIVSSSKFRTRPDKVRPYLERRGGGEELEKQQKTANLPTCFQKHLSLLFTSLFGCEAGDYLSLHG